jgi:hypothetical protein
MTRKILLLSLSTLLLISIATTIKTNAQIYNACNPEKSKNFKSINNNSCKKFIEYYSDLVSTSKKYSTSTLKLTPYILSGLVDRETLWGDALKPKSCAGYGDGDYGHGIVQIHGLFSIPTLGKIAKPNIKIQKSTKKFGNESFNWSSCNESIQYLGAYFLNVEESYKNSLIAKLARGGMNTNLDNNGSFVDYNTQYAYMQLMMDTYNAGGYGVIMKDNCMVRDNKAIDNCTTGKDYGLDVLTRAVDFYYEDVSMLPYQGELFNLDW